MSHELLYTSAPQGLKPGSRGFCTVEMTDGIPPGLVDRLESLSGYRQAFPIHDPRAKLNPVNFSHLIVPAGGRQFHVLSRIADAGQDYTGRSNKLAHHVALEAAERPAGNPAWVLRSPGFCQTSWDGATRTLPSGRRPPSGTRGPAVCRAWQDAAGHAGWAGVLIAAAVVEPGARPVSVIYPAGMDVLPLVEEALALVPGERQWDVTFSTYFTKLPAGIDCQWRFVLDDSPEAQALRRNPHAGAIDLCKELSPPPATSYAEAAQDGRIVAIEARPVERPDSVFRRPAITPGAPPPRAALAKSAPAAPPAMDTVRTPSSLAIPPSLDSLMGQTGRRKSNRTLIITIASAVALVAVGVGAAVFLAGSSKGTDLVRMGEERLPRQREGPPLPSAEQISEQRAADDRKRQAEDAAARERLRQAEEPRPDEQMVRIVDANQNDVPQQKAPPMRVESPLRDIQRPDRPRVGEYPLLALPVRDFSLGGPRGAVSLAKIHAASPQECDLTIAGSEIALGSGRQYRIERKDEGGSRLWEVTTQTPNAIGRLPRAATFLLKGKPPEFELLFQWAPPFEAEGGDPQMLRYCLLNVSAQGENEVCALAAPETVAKIRLDLNNRIHREPMKLAIPREADEHVRLDIWFEDPAGIIVPGQGGSGREKESGLVYRDVQVGGDNPLFQVLLGKEVPVGADGQPVEPNRQQGPNQPPGQEPQNAYKPPLQGAGQRYGGQSTSKAHCVALDVGFRREKERLEIGLATLAFPPGFEEMPMNPPAYRFFEPEHGESWDREEFGNYRDEMRKQGVYLKTVGTTFDERLKFRKDRLANAERLNDPNFATYKSDLEVWKSAHARYQRAVKLTESADSWCDDMLDFFGQIERGLRIGYRVYIVVEGQEIELVRTVDAEQSPAAAGGF